MSQKYKNSYYSYILLHMGFPCEETHLPRSSGNGLPSAAWDGIGLLCYKNALLARVQCGTNHQDPQVLFPKSSYQVVSPSLYHSMRLFLPRCRCRFLHFPLLNCVTLVCSFLQPDDVPLNGSTMVPPLPVLCHLQTCCGCTLSHCLGH